MKPNVVLIMVDQMRSDCIGVSGHPIVETPYLDTMAREGYMFSNAYSAAPSCIAARASLLTGLTPASHGRVGYQDKVPWNYEYTLPGELSKSGYHTQCVGKMHVYPTRNLLGFHNVILHDGYMHYCRNNDNAYRAHWNQCDDYLNWLRKEIGSTADIIDSGLDCNSWVARPWPYEERLHPTNWVVTESIDFLRRKDPTKPFFLMMSFVRPHSPLDPPQVYYDQYINQDIPLPPVGNWVNTKDEDKNGLLMNCSEGIINPKALKRARAAYYALITHIDHQIGRFLQALSEYNELNNTIFIFSSDHGDLLGDHNLFRKSLPYNGSASIPFIVYDPGNLLGGERGAVIDKPCEIMDIMPTLLDAAGVDIPDCVEGKSLIPVIKDENHEWRDYIHGEHFRKDPMHYVTNGKEKFIWFSKSGTEQFFDLVADPMELNDLSADPKFEEKINYWRNIMIKELVGREEGYTDGKQLFAGRKSYPTLSHILK